MSHFQLNPNSVQSLFRIFFYTVLVLVLSYGIVEWVIYLTIDFPFNFFESEIVVDSWDFSRGNYLYPSREIGPYGGLYSPGVHLILAFLFQIMPTTIITARFVSFVAMGIIIYVIWKQCTQNNSLLTLSLSAAAILMWHSRLLHFDMHGKPDTAGTLFIILTLAALLTYYNSNFKNTYLIYSLIFLILSVVFKQNNLFVLPPVLLFLFFSGKLKEAAIYLLSFILLIIPLFMLLASITGPDFYFYLFQQPASYGMRWGVLGDGITHALYTFPFFIFAMTLLYKYFNKEWDKSDTLFLLFILFSYPAVVLSAAKGGGLSNSYQPLFYILSFYLIYNLDYYYQKLSHSFTQTTLALVLLLTAHINPISFVTSVFYRYRASTNYTMLIKELQHNSGTIYSGFDNYLSLKAGKPINWSAKWEIETADKGKKLPKESYHSLALESDQVVTIYHYSWANEFELEKKLVENGYLPTHKMEMDQLRSYTLWRKP